MATTYYIYAVIEPADGTEDGGNAELHYLGAADGFSAHQAARAFLRDTKPKTVPKRMALVPARSVHFLSPSVTTIEQLRFE